MMLNIVDNTSWILWLKYTNFASVVAYCLGFQGITELDTVAISYFSM